MLCFKLFITSLLVLVATSINVNHCNYNLLTSNNTNNFTVTLPREQEFVELGSEQFWKLKGGIREFEVNFLYLNYVTGIGIKVNTEERDPCNTVEDSIDLSEFEVLIDNQRIDFANRNTVNDTFIKVSFFPVKGRTVQIGKVSMSASEPLIYCIQYQLYGCTGTPTDCAPLLSYDTTEPVIPDSSYSGVCKNGMCSGGLGVLMDKEFDVSLRWTNTAEFSLSFYQQVGIAAIAIFLNSSTASISVEPEPQNSLENSGQIDISVGKITNFFEFSLTVGQGNDFELKEIKIFYWSDLSIPCDVQAINEEATTSIYVPIGIGIVMFSIGLVIPIIIWFTRRKTKRLVCCVEKQVVERGPNAQKTEHLYTDIKSKASVTHLTPIVPVTIQPVTAQSPLPGEHAPPLAMQKANFVESIEEQVKKRTIERGARSISPISPFLEDNPLYSDSDPEKIERFDSEVFTRDNPQYVTTEMMRANSAIKNKGNLYANSNAPIEDPGFENYDKLDHGANK